MVDVSILWLFLISSVMRQMGISQKPCDISVTTPAPTHTLGREALEPELCVVMVSTVVMPRPTLAGAASMFIQKDTHDRMTMRREGMYIWIR